MLFKFKIEPNDDSDIDDVDMINFNSKLQDYNIIYNKILTFAYNIINNHNSPSDLKTILSPENINVIEQEDTPKNFTQLRFNRQIRKNIEPITRYNQLTFSFFSKY